MKLFDSHCHLDDRIYDKDFKDVLSRAKNAGVSGIMIVGVDKKSSERAVTLAESKPGLYASVGFHPHDAKECSKEALQFLIKLAKSPKVKAWGEIGLGKIRKDGLSASLRPQTNSIFRLFSMKGRVTEVFWRF